MSGASAGLASERRQRGPCESAAAADRERQWAASKWWAVSRWVVCKWAGWRCDATSDEEEDSREERAEFEEEVRGQVDVGICQPLVHLPQGVLGELSCHCSRRRLGVRILDSGVYS